MSDILKKHIHPRVGVGILIYNEKNEILLGKRINAHGEFSWGPPGGHLEYSETLEECAAREVQEETGMIISEPKFLAVTNDIFEEDDKHYISIFMTSLILANQEPKNLEPHKTTHWEWFSISNLPSPLFLPLHQLRLNKSYGKPLSDKL